MKPRYDPRVFLALTLSRTAQQRLAAVQDELKQYLASWHYIPPTSFHMTLRYLGEVPEQMIADIDKACSKVASTIQPFSLNWTHLDFFGEPDNARVLFASADACSEMDDLAAKVADRFRSIRDERKVFRPHITLAKARKQMEKGLRLINGNMLRRLRELGRIGPDEMDVKLTTVHREFVLMETIWVGRTVEYEVRARYALHQGEK